MWVLVASDRAFDTPCLWRVFQISCWNRLMVRASATNSWSRERRAQAIHPARSSSPRRPLVAKTARSCSLSRYARYSAELVVLILARLSCWSSVRSAGFLTTAQRALRSLLPACSRVRRRTWSRAFVPHITTWNGSRQIAACGAFCRTTAWIHSAPSAETCVSRAHLVVPSASKNNVKVSLVAALVGPHEATGVMVDHTREESVSLPVGNFVDPDAGKPVELIGFPGQV